MMYKEINDKARLPNQRNDSSAFESGVYNCAGFGTYMML